MLEHNANLFYFTTHQLQWLQRQITNAIEERGGSDLPTKIEADKTRRLLKRIEREAEKLKFSRVLERLDNFEDDPLLQPLVGPRFTLELLRRELKEVDREIARALGQNKFMMIPANEARYYNNPELFGSEVAARFSGEANKEIVEAGNCYATGSYTACVFHLMRTVEYGVRALVTTFKIKFKNKPKLTVEFRQWGEILGAIQEKIEEIEKRKKSRLRDEKLEFLRDGYMQFRHLKDKWRNHVMHTRDSYDANDARKTMQYVEEFMQHLATRLKAR